MQLLPTAKESSRKVTEFVAILLRASTIIFPLHNYRSGHIPKSDSLLRWMWVNGLETVHGSYRPAHAADTNYVAAEKSGGGELKKLAAANCWLPV